ncbi:TVP38/TMEM64 family protein [Aequorivita echinoideorum]|uniref:TVP38/TMEM64 family membrane protein n=1 Tax=Aequorivita echinoideorum TaxID=1549647 RepID=A0ABS5S905_9FLAO|nr:TVP38/TMEM64 family protein [Aequorivita echinoideorum]MBT0608365.1 TVP38/TMEM64 family protein [Aequorivita echinoideorum]
MKNKYGNSGNPTSKKSKLPLFFSLFIIVVLILLYFLEPTFQDFCQQAWQILTSNDEEKINNWVTGLGWWGPLVLIAAMVVQMFLIVIPSILLIVVSVLAYGPILGSIISVTAVVLASTIGYFIGRYIGPWFAAQILGKKKERTISRFLDDYGFWAVVITRINPFLSNDAISFVAGILKMDYFKFISATLAGIAPLILFLAIMGENFQTLKTGLLIVSVISLFIFGIYLWIKKRHKLK